MKSPLLIIWCVLTWGGLAAIFLLRSTKSADVLAETGRHRQFERIDGGSPPAAGSRVNSPAASTKGNKTPEASPAVSAGRITVPFRFARKFIPTTAPANFIAPSSTFLAKVVDISGAEKQALDRVLNKINNRLQSASRPWPDSLIRECVSELKGGFLSVLGSQRGLLAAYYAIPNDWARKDSELSALVP